MASMTTVKCQCCRKSFEARTADVKRGWGKFCSKSCKAKRQSEMTEVSGPHFAASGRTAKEMSRGIYTESLYRDLNDFDDDYMYGGDGWGAVEKI